MVGGGKQRRPDGESDGYFSGTSGRTGDGVRNDGRSVGRPTVKGRSRGDEPRRTERFVDNSIRSTRVGVERDPLNAIRRLVAAADGGSGGGGGGGLLVDSTVKSAWVCGPGRVAVMYVKRIP